MLGLVVIVLAMIIALLGANIRKDKTPKTNEMALPIAAQKPGFSITMLKIRLGSHVEKNIFWKQMFFGGTNDSYRKIPLHSYGFQHDILWYSEYTGDTTQQLPIFKLKMTDVLFAVSESTYDSIKQNITYKDAKGQNIVVSQSELIAQIKSHNIYREKFYLGTDKYGRDLLSRILAGTIISLSVGLIAVIISLVLGIFLGALAGYFGGKTDAVISWIINVIWSVPTLLLVISVTLLLGKGFSQIFIAVGLTMWVEVARITRGQFMSLREKEFVEAALALGYKPFRIIFKHILPNAWSPLIVISASNFANAILIEAGLSFLGVGAQPPVPSWGNILKEHYSYIVLNKAYLALIPGSAIMLLVLAFTLLGNGLRDALDTRIANE